ncbi:MAG: low-specificity L-threonine aldolase [bacterium]
MKRMRKPIDLRSDTVTLPTDEMRQAMFNAVLGDDVFGEDPTINKFQDMAAELVGKEAALLVASGTMANLVCMLTHCARGEEAILGDKAHIFLNEAGGISAVGAIHPHLIPNQPDGTLQLDDIKAAIRGVNAHWPRTRLICLENTHNRCYGAALTPEYIDSVGAIAKEHRLSLYLDGARIFNAVVALGRDVKEFTRNVDSISFCLSKGLSAPIGSVICGTREFISEAHRYRKLLGGGMRQAGIIAGPGIVALERMVERLAEDHVNAKKLARGISQIPGLSIDLARVQTNILYFDLKSDKMTPDDLLQQLDARGVKILQTENRRFRIVTHYGIRSEHIDAVIVAFQDIM